MFRSIILLIPIFVLGCAKPNYASSSGATVGGGFEGKPLTCQAHFALQNCVAIAWEKMPTETAVGSFLFKVFRPNLADGTPVVEDLAGDMTITLWMPGMGHGSSPVKVQRLDVGTYRATEVFFTMKGEWEIRFQLKERDEVKDQAILPITL
ncbi:MAG: FixH family protein [Bdellovibrionales bacterium]